MFDIQKLYRKIVELANKASMISYVLEFCRIFTMKAKEDIFQYHEELLQQMRLVRAQAESLGIRAELPVDLEPNLMLIAAWQHPQYRDIASEISRKGRPFTLDELLRDLHRQQLLTAHLSGSERERARAEPEAVRIKAAKEASPKPCFAYRKGSCTREDCPYLHEKRDVGQGGAAKKPAEGKPKKDATKKKREVCNYCKKRGHLESVCRSKPSSHAARLEADDMQRWLYVQRVHAAVLVADDTPDPEAIAVDIDLLCVF